MLYPKIKSTKNKTVKINGFTGLIHKSRVPENALSESENLTSDSFPFLRVRNKRAFLTGISGGQRSTAFSFDGGKITALCKINGGVLICTDSYVYFNGIKVPDIRLAPEVKCRSVIPFGQNVFIIPDSFYPKYSDEGFSGTNCTAPFMDFAVEHNNRIWGCRYGKNGKGEYINELYACKAGDPTQWDTFEGISTDSYRVSLGCEGEFTGAAELNDGILFFKEEYIIKVTGDTPSEFSVFSFPARGAEKNSAACVINLNEKIFYKGVNGINVFDGAVSYCISEELDLSGLTDAVGGAVDGKYFIALSDSEGKRRIYVYDTKNGLWHRECDTDTRFMLSSGDCLYFIRLTEDNKYEIVLYDELRSQRGLKCFVPSDGFFSYEYIPEDSVHWYFETGIMGDSENPRKQYLRRLSLVMKKPENSYLRLFIRAEDEAHMTELLFLDRKYEGVYTLPVRHSICRGFKLYFEGEGGFTLYSLIRRSEVLSGVTNDV